MDHTPLHVSSFYGSNEVCELLISKGADPDAVDKVSINSSSLKGGGLYQPRGGDTQIIFWRCAARGLSETITHFLKNFSFSKNGWFDSFWKFVQIRTHFKGFFASKMADFTIFFSQFSWNGTLFLGFFGLKWDPCLRIFGEKLTHLDGTSLYALTYQRPQSTPYKMLLHALKCFKIWKTELLN